MVALFKIFTRIFILLFIAVWFTHNIYCAELPWLKTKGTQIINDRNKKMILKGVCISNNAWGSWVNGISEKLRDQGLSPLVRPTKQEAWVLDDRDIVDIADMGANVVRYLINYELFAINNPLRESNLNRLKTHIRKFNAKGIYVIIDLHMPPGLDWVQNDNYERSKHGDIRLKSIFEDDTYWRDTIAMWKYLANELKDEAGVAGYEVFNEPRLPSEKDGGEKEFKRKYNEICGEIRSIDKKHILFIPDYNSRETNPGEKYWDPAISGWRTDSGEQGIVWKQTNIISMIKVDHDNIVYVAHIYDPPEFTLSGKPLPSYYCSDFNDFPSTYERNLRVLLNWANTVGNAPLIITEYGVTSQQPVDLRLSYLRAVHKIFSKFGLSSTFFEYKAKIGAYIEPKDVCDLYGYYADADKEVENLSLKPWALGSAKNTGFDELFKEYFIKDGKLVKKSLMNNKPIKDELQRYFSIN